MDAKAKRKVIAEWLAELQRDMMAAVDQMPDDWDETELGWYLVHRAEMLTRTADCAARLTRMRLGPGGCDEPRGRRSPSRAPRLRKECNR